MDDLLERARAWIDADPDPVTRAELAGLMDSGDLAELSARMDGTLGFGTAGIRGEVGAGPNRMNRAVVIKTTRGLADHLLEVSSGGAPTAPVVVGFDARPTSRTFAEDTAGVLAAAGLGVVYFADFAPTPLVAYAARHLSAIAAVVITASHNPPRDNGYKVYGSNAAQIIPPTDTEIAAAISHTGAAREIPRVEAAFSAGTGLVRPVRADILDCYWAEVSGYRSRGKGSSLRIVYTPIHGVGGRTVSEIFRRAGHQELIPVPEQAEPDGTFPTVGFPNPEEEGALDLALDLASREGADLVIANDPDADRLAVVVPHADGFRPLTGNEVGVLLGDYVLTARRNGETPITASSVVSSPMFARVAADHGAIHEVTLTGFKWIVNAALSLEERGLGRFLFGYEEALGYTVGGTVRDKDGISAALIFADLAADARDAGETVIDRLSRLWQSHGLWVSAQHSITRTGAEGEEVMRNAVRRIAEEPPGRVGPYEVTGITDYRVGADRRPPWLGRQDLIELTLGDRGRVLVRPSGTEPKLKIYVDLVGELAGDAVGRQAELSAEAGVLARALAADLSL